MIYKCGGTLGDTFMNVLRLYGKNPAKIKHYTPYTEQYNNIEKLYKLIGDVPVEFSAKTNYNILNFQGFLSDGETYDPFPKFNLPEIEKFNLPEEYITLQLQAGVSLSKHPWRYLSKKDLEIIPKDKTVVILGTDKRNIDLYEEYTILDLRNQTSLLESFNIITNSKEFYGPQGLLGFVALSQKVKTTLWLKNRMEINGMANRIGKIKEWDNYITYINLIK